MFVEIARRDRNELVGVVGEEILDALSLIPDLLEVDEREHIEFVSHTSRKTAVAVQNVEEGIAAHFGIHRIRPDDGVGDIVHAVETEVTADTAISELVLSDGLKTE